MAKTDFIKKGDRVDDNEEWAWQDRGYSLKARLVMDDQGRGDDFEEGSCFDVNDKDHGEQNRAIKDAYDEGIWMYYGVMVEAWRCGIKLGEASLWGIEGNFDYEGRTDKHDEITHEIDNTYFNDVMDEVGWEAMEEGKHKIHELMASMLNVEYKKT